MKAFSNVADARRLRWCFVASLILVTIGFALLGRWWIPHATRIAAIPGQRVFRLVFYHTPPKPVIVRQPAPKPIKQPKRREIVKVRPRPRPHPTARPIIVKRRAMLRAPSPRHNPIKAVHPANPGGSASAVPVLAAAPVQTQVTAPTPPAQLPVLMQLHSKLTIARAPPATLDAPSPPDLPTQASGGSGTASGAGADSGSGTGRGSGAGAGTGDGGGPFGIGSGGTGNGEGLRHVVYVLDISGSMISRIDRARYELRQSMDNLRPGESFNIIIFSEEVHEFADFLNPATPFTIARADYFLSTLQVGGGTALEFALRDALGLHGVNVVYVITDGVPTIDVDGGDVQSDDYMKEVPAHVRAMNVNHARIYTIGLVGLDPDGRDPSFAAAGMLRQIARDSGGTSEIVRLGTPAPD